MPSTSELARRPSRAWSRAIVPRDSEIPVFGILQGEIIRDKVSEEVLVIA